MGEMIDTNRQAYREEKRRYNEKAQKSRYYAVVGVVAAVAAAAAQLILTAAVSKLAKRMAAWRQTAALGREELPYTALAGAGRFPDWLMPAPLSCPAGKAPW